MADGDSERSAVARLRQRLDEVIGDRTWEAKVIRVGRWNCELWRSIEDGGSGLIRYRGEDGEWMYHPGPLTQRPTEPFEE